MESSKVATFIGFVLRTRRYKIGANAVETLKRASLIIVCHTASENAKKLAEKFAKRFNCPLLETVKIPLSELTNRENAKIMAVTDFGLSKAILDNADGVMLSKIAIV